MERLTKKKFDFTSDFVVSNLQSYPIAQALKKLQEYEDAEEREQLIMLPCAVGQRLYMIYLSEIIEVDVKHITAYPDEIILDVNDPIDIDFGGEYNVGDIGKILFLSREEAEELKVHA